MDGLVYKMLVLGLKMCFRGPRAHTPTITNQEHQTLPLGLEPTYHTLYLPMHIHTYTCPSNPKVGKCTRCRAREHCPFTQTHSY